MQQLGERLKNPEILGTLYVTLGSLLASFFSYLLQFYLGRKLTVADFGTFTALLSLAYIFSVPAGVFGTSLIKKVASLSGKSDIKALSGLFKSLSILSFVLMLLIFFAFFVLRGVLATFLKIDDSLIIYGFAFLMALSFVGAVPSAYLQGTLRYKAFGAFTSLTSLIRLIFPIILISLGFGVFGAFMGMSFSIVVSYLVFLFLIKKLLTTKTEGRLSGHYQDLLTFGFPVLFVNLGMMLLNNVDLILVKNIFDPATAGYYAGTVTLGKILLFGAGTVTVIMFPKIASQTDKTKIMSLFNFFLSIQLILAIGGVAAFMVFPRLLTVLFFGERFIHSVLYLASFSLFIGLYVLVNFMIMFFLAVNKTNVAYLLVAAVIAQILLISRYHATVFQVIHVDIFVTAVLLVALFVKYVRFSR
jgi:O-antigen/teichoic acid export membrane protein